MGQRVERTIPGVRAGSSVIMFEFHCGFRRDFENAASSRQLYSDIARCASFPQKKKKPLKQLLLQKQTWARTVAENVNWGGQVCKCKDSAPLR